MDILDGVGALNAVLTVASLAIRAFALIDALIRPTEAYVAAAKLTKIAWSVILGLGLAVGLIGLGGFVGLFNIAALIAAIIYLVDVRPAVREVGKPGRSEGPYGVW